MLSNNSDSYRFTDFTFDNYRRLIRLAKSKYRFCGYEINFETENYFILWRHDIEFSVQIACQLAQIEREEKVKSTFFIQLHSEFYNTLDKRNIKAIKESIIDAGHDIGLHFDSHFHEIESQELLEECIIKDRLILEDIFGVTLKSFSFHNNNAFTLSCEDDFYGGLLNVYSKRLKQLPYCSDSLGYWRYDRLQDRLEDETLSKLHVLTHDAMWSEFPIAPRQRILKTIQQDAEKLKYHYDEYLKKYNHLNIDENNIVE